MKNEEQNPFENYQQLLEQKLSADMSFARSLVEHNGERGRLVELVFKKVLEQHLPEAFGVTTGFVIDQHGKLSRQLDLIVYSKATCPFFFNDGLSVIPVEALILAVEVKTKMTLREFQDTREKARSVMNLDRTAYVPQPYIISGATSGKDGRHVPLIIGVSLDSVDTRQLLSSGTGEVIEPVFLSMDGRCLLNGVGPSGGVSWTHEVNYPAAMFVLLASMMTTQAQMVPIDITKYLKVRPGK
ncbi:DUF6602 domain-containing protein [Phaeobacter sp. C3_T13_0]|uniref:DUF6602 domain-containing protein n=1 Tax=Phaeobacter cretensis TaxID=3342641 RepID=UPI0039BC298C